MKAPRKPTLDPRAGITGEYETFDEDARADRKHAEYFYEEYLEDAGYLP